MDNRILLCSDLDRTILPNGEQAESPEARFLLRAFAARPEVTIAYVSGRHKALLEEAISSYDIPVPTYAIGDVGTTIYEIHGEQWHPWEAWSQEIAPDWRGKRHDELALLFADINTLQLQEPEKQNTFKLSYYTATGIDRNELLSEMRKRLVAQDIQASLIWSVDEVADTGLLDVLPEGATKLHAVRFLMDRKGFSPKRTVFSGDSGNDLPALTSGLQAILVRNAQDEVRREAMESLRRQDRLEKLYVARGGFLGMNGNYSAGVLEGIAHFFPETRGWLQEALRHGKYD